MSTVGILYARNLFKTISLVVPIAYPHQPQVCRVVNAVAEDVGCYCALVTSPEHHEGGVAHGFHHLSCAVGVHQWPEGFGGCVRPILRRASASET